VPLPDEVQQAAQSHRAEEQDVWPPWLRMTTSHRSHKVAPGGSERSRRQGATNWAEISQHVSRGGRFAAACPGWPIGFAAQDPSRQRPALRSAGTAAADPMASGGDGWRVLTQVWAQAFIAADEDEANSVLEERPHHSQVS
jgi:hypothetical protein